ncbi:lectin-like domain-containing protein [Levilactobacillus andaensis]|uniref:lectin-like domain-containing protein n=1 Tax=Levilactobacillus andaensis TaxID=2799570 RepID=UPI001941FA36|nr:L-type lectin-domain containing protein [Levilactobacillus andaensis]
MKRWLVGLTVLLGWLAIAGPISGYADVLPKEDDRFQAIAKAPQGVPLDNLFQLGGYAAYTRFIDSPLVPNSIAQITRNNSSFADIQSGAIWSKDGMTRSNNKFDYSKDAEISFWLYFGAKHGDAGDGMAFVLQNSEKGQTATGPAGESMGVWSSDRNSIGGSVGYDTIMNSWALEFDTHVNDNSGGGASNAFDIGKTVKDGPHIASGYPGEKSSYRKISTGASELIHTQPKLAGDLADGNWHHLSLTWKANTKEMSYRFNDRNPDTGQQNTLNVVSDTISIDTSKFNSDNNQVFWGITGSTNAYKSENSFVIVDSADTLGTVKSSADLFDETTKKPIAEGDNVSAGDHVSYKYAFHYDVKSNQDIQPLTMDVPLPTPLKWQSGGVNYQDLGKQDIFSDDNLAQETVHTTWSQPLNGENKTAVVTVTGTVPEVKTKTTVAGVTARFYGPNYQTKLNLPSFNITGQHTLKLVAQAANTTVKHSEPATITGTLTDNDKPIPTEDMQDYHLNAVLNGKATTAGSLDSAGHFNFNIAPKDLKVGDNQLVLVGADSVDAAADDRSHRSNAVTITIKREEGALYISDVAENSTFIPTQLTGRPQWISRQNDWRLKVMDERGANRKWTLQVALGTPFHLKDGSSLMTGDVALRHGHDQDDILKHAAVNVMSKTTTTEDEETDVLPSHWNEVEGLALHVNGGAVAGDYEGTFDWQLVDGPQAD